MCIRDSVGDVAHPGLVGAAESELALEQVWRDGTVVAGVGGGFVGPLSVSYTHLGSDMGQDEKPPRSREALEWFFPVDFPEKTVLSIQRIPPNWSDMLAVSHKKARENPR